MEIQSSCYRWRPTEAHVWILREIYYNSGGRSPTAEQIRWISARLQQYGKIEERNVFYWFQNHKALDRQYQKKEALDRQNHIDIINPNPNPGYHPGSSASASGVNGNYGCMTMDNPFGECSLSPTEGNSLRNWVSVDHHPPSYSHDQNRQRTLLLFPMHREEPSPPDQTFHSGWPGADFNNPTYATQASFDSLELSLGSCNDSHDLSLGSYNSHTHE